MLKVTSDIISAEHPATFIYTDADVLANNSPNSPLSTAGIFLYSWKLAWELLIIKLRMEVYAIMYVANSHSMCI